MHEFQPFPKIPRLNRPIVITEKLDGTNAAVSVQDLLGIRPADGMLVDTQGQPHHPDDDFFDGPLPGIVLPGGVLVSAQSRKRVIAPGKSHDNHGFAAWVRQHAQELADVLGHGLHFGEWYGRGIQRGYGVDPEDGADGKFLALFNTSRWCDPVTHAPLPELSRVPGLTTTPVIGGAPTLDREHIMGCLDILDGHGSYATGADGFPNPEGVVVFHAQGNLMLKATIHDDDRGKEHGG